MSEVLINSTASKPTFNAHWRPVNPNLPGNLYGSSGPLAKYDAAFGTDSLNYELAHNVRYTNWEGHCDKAAIASALLNEPRRAVSINGVTFTPDDIKGLLVKVIMSLPFEMKWIGRRFPDGGLREPSPSVLINGLRQWSSTRRPVVLDVVPGYEVWSYAFDKIYVANGALHTQSRGFPDQNRSYPISGGNWVNSNPDFAYMPVPHGNVNAASSWPVRNVNRMDPFHNPRISPANVYRLYAQSI